MTTRPDQPDSILALVTWDRESAIDKFAALTRDEQLALIRRAPQALRWDVMTLAPDATPLVRALAPPEIHALVRAIDFSMSGTLLECTSPAQQRAVMDLSCWRGDEPDEDATFEWLEWLADLSGDQFGRRIAALDPAFLATVLGPHMDVEPTDNPGEFTVYDTFIRALPVAFRYDEPLVEMMIERIYEADRVLFDEIVNRIFRDERTLDRATHGGLPDQLAEAAVLRARRLGKLSVGGTYEARVDLLRPLEIELIRPRARLHDVLPASVPAVGALDAALAAAGDDALAARWREAFTRLAVDIVMARSGDPGESAATRGALAYARSAVDVALDVLSGGCDRFAAVVAATWEPIDLFRAGNTLLERLRWRVSMLERIPDDEAPPLLVALRRTPIRVLDAATGGARLPARAADVIRAHRFLHALQTSIFRRA